LEFKSINQMNIIQLFLSNLRSENTRRSFLYSLSAFEKVSRKKIESSTFEDILAFKKYLQGIKYSPATINNRLSALSSFYSFCQKHIDKQGNPLIKFNPIDNLSREKVNPYIRARKMSIEDFKKILFNVNRKTKKGKRDYAILIFFVYTGRRRSEVANLNIGDIFETKGTHFYRYKGKGGKEAIRLLPEPVRYALDVYLKCSDRPIKADYPLFSALHRETQLTGQAIGNILREYVDLAGLNTKDYSIHSLRHLSTHLRQLSGQSLTDIQKELDHSSISTTQIYLDNISEKTDESWREISRILNRREE